MSPVLGLCQVQFRSTFKRNVQATTSQTTRIRRFHAKTHLNLSLFFTGVFKRENFVRLNIKLLFL